MPTLYCSRPQCRFHSCEFNILHPLPAHLPHHRTAHISRQNCHAWSTDRLVVLVRRPRPYQVSPNQPSAVRNHGQTLRTVRADAALPIPIPVLIPSAPIAIGSKCRGEYDANRRSSAVLRKMTGRKTAVDIQSVCVGCEPRHCHCGQVRIGRKYCKRVKRTLKPVRRLNLQIGASQAPSSLE